MNIEYKNITLSYDNIKLLETIRYNAYGFKDINIEMGFYMNKLNDKDYLVIGVLLDNKLVGACYIKNTYNSLYIDQLFILKEYQKSSLHLGSNLLKYILINKEIIEKYFKTKIFYSYLDNNKNTVGFYEKFGYRKVGSLMKKRI